MKKLSERLRELAAINRDWNKSAFEAFTDAAEMAQEHEAATGWRPIAEAPKDGAELLVGWYETTTAGDNKWLQALASWNAQSGEWWTHWSNCKDKPAHYLPSPPPPEKP